MPYTTVDAAAASGTAQRPIDGVDQRSQAMLRLLFDRVDSVFSSAESSLRYTEQAVGAGQHMVAREALDLAREHLDIGQDSLRELANLGIRIDRLPGLAERYEAIRAREAALAAGVSRAEHTLKAVGIRPAEPSGDRTHGVGESAGALVGGLAGGPIGAIAGATAGRVVDSAARAAVKGVKGLLGALF